jgi:hypothetical protein
VDSGAAVIGGALSEPESACLGVDAFIRGFRDAVRHALDMPGWTWWRFDVSERRCRRRYVGRRCPSSFPYDLI